jgi:hypothetical protein
MTYHMDGVHSTLKRLMEQSFEVSGSTQSSANENKFFTTTNLAWMECTIFLRNRYNIVLKSN